MKYPFVQQKTENDCGLACLAMIYRFYFKDIFRN
ncbi:cysteine peptidase family C39 domain-containing protein [Spiroplasma endosymbiont of Colias croceus]